jgi:hypothetical protein
MQPGKWRIVSWGRIEKECGATRAFVEVTLEPSVK